MDLLKSIRTLREESATQKAARKKSDWQTLVAAYVDGKKLDPVEVDTTLTELGKTPDDLEAAGEKLKERRRHQEIADGYDADFIKANLPRTTDPYQRDTYYWYYATQVMFQLKGDYWRTWSEHLYPLLINSQVPNGSLAGSTEWDINGEIAAITVARE